MSEQSSILVVDDDPRLCSMLQRYLGAVGYQVDTALDGESMFKSISTRAPDLILLDLNLPDAHGFDLAKQLRHESNVGIIILTGSHDSVDRVVGLELGADDYVEKPFEERELLARIRSVLRRVQQNDAPSLSNYSTGRFACWCVDFVAHELRNDAEEPVHLTSHEYDLLNLFVHNAGRALSRDEILQHVYGRAWEKADRSVDILVGKLRRKLGDEGSAPQIIKAVRSTGYILTAQVEFA